jgi:mannose PTS system EIIA component
MIPVLVLTHGNLAQELLRAGTAIDPQLAASSEALSLPWDASSEDGSRELREALKRLDSGHGVLVLTDMFGGTATNLALPFLERGTIEVVTGVNLPMLVKLGSLSDQEISLHDLAVKLTHAGQKSIRVASEFLHHSG